MWLVMLPCLLIIIFLFGGFSKESGLVNQTMVLWILGMIGIYVVAMKFMHVKTDDEVHNVGMNNKTDSLFD